MFAPVQETGVVASIEVLASPERRRRWSSEQKQAIVAGRGGVCARCGGTRCGALGRRDIEFDLPLAAGFASGGERLCAGADGTVWRRHGRPAAAAGDRDRICRPCPRPDPGVGAARFGGCCRGGIGTTVILVPSGVRVWLAVGHTDMRRGMNSVAIQVRQGLGRDPHAGDLYVFRGKRGQRATFCIRFSIRDGRLPLAPAVRADLPGVAVSARQEVDVHLYVNRRRSLTPHWSAPLGVDRLIGLY